MKFCVQGCFRVELTKIVSDFLQKFSLRDKAENLNLFTGITECFKINHFVHQSIRNDEMNLNMCSD